MKTIKDDPFLLLSLFHPSTLVFFDCRLAKTPTTCMRKTRDGFDREESRSLEKRFRHKKWEDEKRETERLENLWSSEAFLDPDCLFILCIRTTVLYCLFIHSVFRIIFLCWSSRLSRGGGSSSILYMTFFFLLQHQHFVFFFLASFLHLVFFFPHHLRVNPFDLHRWPPSFSHFSLFTLWCKLWGAERATLKWSLHLRRRETVSFSSESPLLASVVWMWMFDGSFESILDISSLFSQHPPLLPLLLNFHWFLHSFSLLFRLLFSQCWNFRRGRNATGYINKKTDG